MNNKVIIGVIIAVLVVGGGWYLMSSKGGSVSGVSSESGTMNQLLASKDALECVYTQANDQADTTGTLYVASGKVRGDFVIQTKALSEVPAQKFESHLITDGQQVMLWPLSPEAPTQGVTIKVDPARKDQVNLDQSFNAKCKPWTKDDSKFTAPSDIQFSDAAVLEQALQAQAQAAAEAQAKAEIKLSSTTPVE